MRFDRLIAWLRDEIRLLGLASWSDGAYEGAPEPEPCTAADPRCAALIERAREVRDTMISRRIPMLTVNMAERRRGAAQRDVPQGFLAHTDVAATFDAIRRVSVPPVRLLRKGAK